MPGRFKKEGTFYVSEWGGDSLNDGSAETPFAHPSDVTTSNVWTVLGTGVYKNQASTSRRWQGDGNVKLIASPALTLHTNQFKNIHLIGASSTQQISTYYTECIIEDFTSIGYGSSCLMHRCVIKGSFQINGSPSNNVWNQIHNCIILCDLGGSTNYQFQGNYLAKGCNFTIAAVTDSYGNCINGTLTNRATGLVYEFKTYYDGVPRPDANPAYGDVLDIWPNITSTFQNFACREEEVKFLDVNNKLVEPDSMLLSNAYMGHFIGAVKPAKFIPITDSNFQVTFTRMDTTNPDSVVVSSGELDGTVRMTGKISNSLVSSSLLVLRSILQFWKGATAGTSENNNVPDAVKTLGLLASEIDKPRRLTYLMRTSQDANANQASPVAIWDNDSAPEGEYLLFEANTIPAHIGSVYGTLGNGDPRATGGTESSFNFRSVDIIFMLDNDRD